jgi:predicted HicB family RNase H-like nuclease
MAKGLGANITTFTMRIPKDMLIFLKKTAADQETSISSIVIRCLDKYRKKAESKITQ